MCLHTFIWMYVSRWVHKREKGGYKETGYSYTMKILVIDIVVIYSGRLLLVLHYSACIPRQTITWMNGHHLWVKKIQETNKMRIRAFVFCLCKQPDNEHSTHNQNLMQWNGKRQNFTGLSQTENETQTPNPPKETPQGKICKLERNHSILVFNISIIKVYISFPFFGLYGLTNNKT